MTSHVRRPWHRELWPWLLMSGPAAVVIAGTATLWLAVASNDGLVVDDYYKRGLAINQTLSRERQAAASNYRAQASFNPGFDRVRIVVSGAPLPQALILRLVHPTRSGWDQSVRLAAVGAGVYEGSLVMPQRGLWRIIVEDDAGAWRLHGECSVPTELTISLESKI
jgi:uncharacterized protein